MSNEQTLSRRERRAMARRTQIIDGAARVFAEKGYHAATTREIAQAADVSEGSIYHYFDSKKDLLIEIMGRLSADERRVAESALDSRARALATDTRHLLKEVLHARQAFVTENEPMLRAVISEIHIDEAFAERYYEKLLPPTLTMLEHHLQKRIDQGDIREIDTALFARFFLAANFGLFELLFLGDPLLEAKWGSDELLEALVGFLIDGLAPHEDDQESKA